MVHLNNQFFHTLEWNSGATAELPAVNGFAEVPCSRLVLLGASSQLREDIISKGASQS